MGAVRRALSRRDGVATGDPEVVHPLAVVLSNLSSARREQQPDVATDLAREAVELLDEIAPKRADHPQYPRHVASAHANLIQAHLETGDVDAARDRLVGRSNVDHSDPTTCRELAELWLNLYERLDDVEQREQALEEALRMLSNAVRLGYDDVADLTGSQSLAPLRDTDAFQALLRSLQ